MQKGPFRQKCTKCRKREILLEKKSPINSDGNTKKSRSSLTNCFFLQKIPSKIYFYVDPLCRLANWSNAM